MPKLTLLYQREGIRIADEILTELAFSADQKAAVFGRYGTAWADLKAEITSKIDKAADATAITVIDIKANLDAIEPDLKVQIKWLSATHEIVGGKSAKALMLAGPEGVQYTLGLLHLMTGAGPELAPEGMKAASRLQMPEGLIL